MIKILAILFVYTAVMLSIRLLGDVKIPWKIIFIPAAAGAMVGGVFMSFGIGVQMLLGL